MVIGISNTDECDLTFRHGRVSRPSEAHAQSSDHELELSGFIDIFCFAWDIILLYHALNLCARLFQTFSPTGNIGFRVLT